MNEYMNLNINYISEVVLGTGNTAMNRKNKTGLDSKEKWQ